MKLCLITSNIRFDNPADGQNSWSHRRDFLASTLLKYHPDVIATQEGRIHQLNDLKDALLEFELIEQHRSWIKERMYPSFFVRKDTFEYLGSGDIWLSETPDIAGSRSFDSTFPRLMTWIKLQPKNGEDNLLIVNTHLDHIKSETRQGQVRVLIQEIEKLKSASMQLVMMGDFNESPDGEVRKIIIENLRQLKDAWKEFNSVEETSHHAFKGEMQNGARIDWILVDERLKIESCSMDKSILNGAYPSDHFPIVCQIRL